MTEPRDDATHQPFHWAGIVARVAIAVGVVLLHGGIVTQAQGTVQNPSSISFMCGDHDRDDEHEVSIIDAKTGMVVRTVLLGDPEMIGSLVIAPIDIRSLPFGVYVWTVRVIASGISAAPSDPSEPWERSPMRATNVGAR